MIQSLNPTVVNEPIAAGHGLCIVGIVDGVLPPSIRGSRPLHEAGECVTNFRLMSAVDRCSLV